MKHSYLKESKTQQYNYNLRRDKTLVKTENIRMDNTQNSPTFHSHKCVGSELKIEKSAHNGLTASNIGIASNSGTGINGRKVINKINP